MGFSYGKYRLLLNVTNNTKLETTYEFLSEHIIIMTVVQKRLKIVPLEIEYTVLLNTLTIDNESVSDK